MVAAFKQQWRLVSNISDRLVFTLGSLPNVALLAWIAKISESSLVLAYVSVGVIAMGIWNSSVFRVGWSLMEELIQGTLDLNVVSRTPLMMVAFGKTIAHILSGAISGMVGFCVVLAISQKWVHVDNIPLLVLSLAAGIIALATGVFVFAPLMVWARGRGGFFNAIIPFGVVCSGFFYPIATLPMGLEIIALGLPTSWAMNAVIQSIDGGSVPHVAKGCLMGVGMSAVYLIVTALLFRTVEHRMRVKGAFTAY